VGGKLLIETLAGRPGRRVPMWLMRQAGRYLPEYQRLRAGTPDFLRFCYTPALTVEAALQPLRRYPLDAAILFSDILVVPDALGRDVRFVEGTGPVLAPLRTEAEVDALNLDRIEAHLEPLAVSVRQLKAALPADVALIGFAGAPWTLAHYVVEGRGGSDGAFVRQWAYRAPEVFGRLIDRLAAAVVRTLSLQIAAGAEVVQLFDSWAGGLPEGLFRRVVVSPTRAIVNEIHARHPGVPVIGFPRGAGVLCADFVRETGVDAISLDPAVPAGWAAERLQTVCPVQGNLDNHLLVAGGDALVDETERLLQAFAGGGHVFNLGHGILPETPPENVARLAATVRAWARG
jgi:uroporphyrinogen decarboxylase